MAYHHFYLIANKVTTDQFQIKIIINKLSHKKFILDFNGDNIILNMILNGITQRFIMLFLNLLEML
jgi:hypothetical protein